MLSIDCWPFFIVPALTVLTNSLMKVLLAWLEVNYLKYASKAVM